MTDQDIWARNYKLPWDDPDFSRRMLAEHLAQSHDMASRRLEWIDRQVEWIHRKLLAGNRAAILDLGCGPGFYSHRLAAAGHRCQGIDFGPASIEYAQRNNPDRSRCGFQLADIRHAAYGGPYDLAMILFGEMNVFSPDEIRAILERVKTCLVPDRGVLILEVQTPEGIEASGRSEPSDGQFSSGLFSDYPYHCRTESEWVADQQTAIQTFTINDTAGETKVYHCTTRAWNAADLTALLSAAGFDRIQREVDWPSNTEALSLWSGFAKP